MASATPSDAKLRNEELLPQVWIPGSPVIVQRNAIFGRYTVASRRIQRDELLGEEYPLVVAAYSPSSEIRPCLSCCKDIVRSSASTQGATPSMSPSPVCSKCKWPVCSEECQNAFQHADNECKILAKIAKNAIEPSEDRSADDYLSIEVLRALLIRDRDPETWNRILGMEAHMEERANSKDSSETTKMVIRFIRDLCQQTQFDSSIVDRILGIITVNSFWIYKDCQRYASALYEKMSLIPNDCDGNTRRTVELIQDIKPQEDANKNTNPRWGFVVREFASREINAGEIITARYSQISDVNERRAFLKSLFHFDCSCHRCIVESKLI